MVLKKHKERSHGIRVKMCIPVKCTYIRYHISCGFVYITGSGVHVLQIQYSNFRYNSIIEKL